MIGLILAATVYFLLVHDLDDVHDKWLWLIILSLLVLCLSGSLTRLICDLLIPIRPTSG